MIHAVIIDDERGNRENLEKMIAEFCPDVKIVATAGSAKEGIVAINSFHPELVFLDIEMPFGNGFSMLEEIGDIDFEVVFVTAYDKYAIRAIKFSALDYLLKPLMEEDLIHSVKKAAIKISKGQSNKTQIETLFSNLKNQGKNPVKIAVPDATGFNFIELKKIIRIESAAKNCYLFLDNGTKICVHKMLKEFEEILGEDFFRIHYSHIINLQHARKYLKGDGGSVLMSDGKEVEVSRRKKEEVLLRMSLI